MMNRTGFGLLTMCAVAFVSAVCRGQGAAVTGLSRIPDKPPQALVPKLNLGTKPAGTKGAYTGFDVMVGDNILAPVRFGSNGLITAADLDEPEPGVLRFTQLTAAPDCGLKLSESSFVAIKTQSTVPYPEVSFQIGIESFVPEKWEAAAGGPCPFHFLTLSLDGAQALHHRGWLVATPALDHYTLLEGRPGIVASKWSKNWTWAPPFGACPIPVAGLWAPQTRRYVAFDFTEARLKDHSEKNIASAYCWQQGKDSSFVTLVYPRASRYIALCHPQGGETIASHFQIVYDMDLPYWDDPNQRYHERLWKTYYDLLPGAPAQNDLNFLPGYAKLLEFSGPGVPQFTYQVPKKDNWESNFWEEGTIIPSGPEVRSLDVLYLKKDEGQLKRLKDQLPYLTSKAQRFEFNGEPCVYWQKPLEGKPKTAYAGDPSTLRNIHGWSIAEALLAVYAHEKNDDLLPLIDGALNWTRYNICTRNDISDVPEAMFTIGWPGMDFCLRYYYAFRDDPARRDRAETAYRLARALAYRYTTMWIPDTAEDDNIEGTFLIEPNSGQPWTGAACANECCMFIDAFARLYTATGDPIILAYLRGMLERWTLLYQDADADNIWDYAAPFAECFGIFDDCAIGGRNKRSTYGGNVPPFEMVQPVGNAKVRVIAGEKGAAAFDKFGMHTDIAEFRVSRDLANGLSFKVVSTLDGDFDLVLTTPQFMLLGRKILVERDGAPRELQPGKDLDLPGQSPWNAVLHGIRNGDRVAVDKLDPSLPVLDCTPVKSWALNPRDFSGEGFRLLAMDKICNWSPSLDWEKNDSYAPYFPGDHYAYGVPYFLIPAYLNGGKTALTEGDLPVDAPASALAFFVSELADDTAIRIEYADGVAETVPVAERAVAWKAWPKWFPAQIELVPYKCRDARITNVHVKGAKLWAVTLAANAEGASKIMAVVDQVRRDKEIAEREKQQREEWLQRCNSGHALLLEADCTEPGYAFCYVTINRGHWEIPKNSFLEYDILIPFDSIRATGGVDLTGGALGNIRDVGGCGHPGQPNEPRGQWKHWKMDMSGLAGKTFENAVIATDGSNCPTGRYKGLFKNICLTDAQGGILQTLYDNTPEVPLAQPEIAANGSIKNMGNWSVKTVTAQDIHTQLPPPALIMDAHGIARDDFSLYPEGSSGAPAWTAVNGSWVVRDGQFIGANCDPQTWTAVGASAGDTHWRDYELSLRFKILERGSDWRDGPWIGFRASKNGNWAYSLNFHGKNIALHKAYLGRRSADANPLAEIPWTPDKEWHQVLVKVRGNRIQVEVDGHSIIDVADDNHLGIGTIPSGGIVLCARRYTGSQGDTRVAFDDIEVRALE